MPESCARGVGVSVCVCMPAYLLAYSMLAGCLHTSPPPKQQPQTQRINGDSQNDGDFACDWAAFSFDTAQDDQVREQPHTSLVLLVLNTVQTTTVTTNIYTLALVRP